MAEEPLTDVQRRARRLRMIAKAEAANDQGEPPAEQLAKCRFELVQVKDPERMTGRMVRRNLSSRNLERWLSRGVIDERGYRAGDRYRSTYERAGFQQRVTSAYDIVTAGGQGATYSPPMPGTIAQMDAWRAWREARDDLGRAAEGFDQLILHDALMDELSPLEQMPDAIGLWATRHTIRLSVRICIDRLVVFYRL